MKILKDDNKKDLRIFTELMNKMVGKDKKVRKFKIGKIAMENEGDLAYNQAKAEVIAGGNHQICNAIKKQSK